MMITANLQRYTPFKRNLPQEVGPLSDPASLKAELVELSQRGQQAYRCGMGGLVGLAAGSGTAGAGLWLHSARVFGLGLAVAALGGALLPVSMMTLAATVEKADQVDDWLRRASGR